MSAEEKRRLVDPIVPASLQHNARVFSQIRSLTASLFGICAGILGLESTNGFIFYFIGTILVSQLSAQFLASGKPSKFFEVSWSGLYLIDVFGGLMSYVLTWTLFYGLIQK